MKQQLCMCCLCVDIVVLSVAKWLRHPSGNLETQVRFLVEHIYTCLLSCADFGSQIVTLFGKSRLNENSVEAFFRCNAFSMH